jgi:glycosyltransferase involved in cell wall biosynthesis
MRLDIMMPFYGRIDHFRAAVDSVRAQTDPDWRLVVTDDNYPDPSAGQWLLSLDDSRIEYIRNETNLGINANFQASLDRATAEWLTVFGCDDIMLPGYVARVKQLVSEHPTATIVQPGVRIIDDAGKATSTLVDRAKELYRPRFTGTIVLTGERLAASITRGNWMYFPALAWRREPMAAVGFRANLNVVQDLALALDLILDGAVLVADSDLEFEYRRHASSVSSWRAVDGSRFIEEQTFFRRMSREFDARGWRRAKHAAVLHLSSRINALTRMPDAIKARDFGSMRILTRHALGMHVTRSQAELGRP